MDRLIKITLNRGLKVINVIFPKLQNFSISPTERRYKRNADRIRNILSLMIDERRKMMKNYSADQADLLSILIQNEFFESNDNLIVDELVTFFFAGMKTIQATTTNLIFHMEANPELKLKLLSEILPPVEKATNNIVEDLHYDTVMDFEMLQRCFQETLRIEPPITVSTTQRMTKEVTINNITFKKDTEFAISMHSLHHDPT